LTVV
jgi:Ras family protein A